MSERGVGWLVASGVRAPAMELEVMMEYNKRKMVMRNVVLVTLLFCSFPASAQTLAAKRIHLTVSLQKGSADSSDQEMPIARLVLCNNTDTVAGFYSPYCVYGYDAIRFELRQRDSVFTLYGAIPGDDRFVSNTIMLSPGDSLVIQVPLRQCKPRASRACMYVMPPGYPFPVSAIRGATIRAFYKVNIENHLLNLASLKTFALALADSRSVDPNEWLKFWQPIVTDEIVSEVVTVD